MFTRRNFFIIVVCSCLVFGAVWASATLPVASNSNVQIAAAADVVHTANYRVAGESSDHIIFQAEPTPVLSVDTPTDEPAPVPTAVIVVTPDPNDPVTNPSAPGGTLTGIINFVVGAITGGITMLVGMLALISRLKDDAVAKTTIERLIDGLANSFPATAPFKPLLNRTGKEMQSAGAVLEEVTDGKPNLP